MVLIQQEANWYKSRAPEFSMFLWFHEKTFFEESSSADCEQEMSMWLCEMSMWPDQLADVTAGKLLVC